MSAVESQLVSIDYTAFLPYSPPVSGGLLPRNKRTNIPKALQSTSEKVVARKVNTASVPASASVSRRDAIDAVNLNVDGDAGLTMTFVETVDDDDE
jgi:hypothetical protein